MDKKSTLFYNQIIDKKALKKIMALAFKDFGAMKASYLADQLKNIGFKYSTKSGLSISIEDLKVPPLKRNLLKLANRKIEVAELQVKNGEITEVEKFERIIKTWNLTSEALKDQVINYFRETDPLNSIYMMAFSGARGNVSQVRQLVGMRGLMADPNGQIINIPILNNFREGLTITDYIISSYGARKGLVDTALRTADSGYLTRRLIDVAQDVITREKDCKTRNGVTITRVTNGNRTVLSLKERIIGRVLSAPIKDLMTGELIAKENQEITSLIAEQIEDSKVNKVVVRSPLTCSSSRSVCQQCYGWNLAYGKLIDLGEAVGIIAAQSIGEPGTQLTMRTFHTGGVFTAESSVQVKAKFSGKIVFSKALRVHKTRTAGGEFVFVAENESTVDLVTYENLKLNLLVSPKTLIFVENNTFVRKDEILFEFPTGKTNQLAEEKAFKYIYADQSGEVFFDSANFGKSESKDKFQPNPNFLIWIFFGQVFNVSVNTKLNAKSNFNACENSVLTESKFVTVYGGKINLISKNELNLLKYSSKAKSSNIYIENAVNGCQDCVIYGSMNRKILLKTINSLNITKNLELGELINLKYQTKTGGTFYSSDFNRKKEKKLIKKNKTKIVGGTVFYLPESTFVIDKSITQSQLSVKNGDYVKVKAKIFKGINANISGIVYIVKNKRSIKEIVIKPGQSYLLKKNKHKLLKSFDKQLLYPGEVAFEIIKVNQLSLLEITKINEKIFLNVFPIVRYEITNTQNQFDFFRIKNIKLFENLKIGEMKIKFQNDKPIKSITPLQIVSYPVLNQFVPISSDSLLIFKLNKIDVTQKRLKLDAIYQEKLNINEDISKSLKKENIRINLLVQNSQYFEPYTNLNSHHTLVGNRMKVLGIKQQIERSEKKILLKNDNDYQTIYLENKVTTHKPNSLIKLNKKGKDNYIFQTSGFITEIIGSGLNLKKGRPYLFSQGARIYKRSGDLVKQGEIIGQLTYRRAKTEDIVQGLPKVEEILEVRKPKFEASLAIRPGIVSDIVIKKSEFQVWVSPMNSLKSQRDFYKINYSQRLLVGLFEFINVGQPLYDAPINAHTVLDTYFFYFKSLKLFSSYNSAYRSFRKIQGIFLNAVQAVYYTQGVTISDKHIEIILKQMIGKVQILSSGYSPLLPDEIVELKQIFYINNSLEKKNGAVFKPIILGITKASLKTNSFISAASFQHTTKILTEAAIQGKSDWLRGLKENVIIGRLIPVGTGFNRYSDISYMKVKIPSPFALEKTNFSSNFHYKYKNLKNKIKFKFSK